MPGTSSGPDSSWIRALPLADLHPGHPRLLRLGGQPVALFRLTDGRVFAVDNRCPHEGYPLVQGAVSGQTLTCVWHNFKFDLQSGECLLGDEDVRTFPVRIVDAHADAHVEVDVRPPDRAAELARLWASLSVGLSEGELGRMARDVARLIEAGVETTTIALFAARWDAEHAEYGSTHALPVAADVAALSPRWTGQEATLPLVQLLSLASRPSIRRPARPAPAPVDPGEDPVAAGQRLQALVESEDAVGAEALVLGAVARGWRRAELEPWFLALCTEHFLDFGHMAIYTVKVMDMLDRAGWADAAPILGALVYAITLGTREDLLPPWAGTRKRLALVEPDLPRWWAMARGPQPGWERADDEGPRGLVDAILGRDPAVSFKALRAALEQGAPLERIADALVLAASERILRFDVRLDRSVDVQNDWLDVTHLLTFAGAVRQALGRVQDPRLLRLIFHSAHFTQRAGVLDGARQTWEAREGELAELKGALQARDPALALSIAAGLLARPGGLEALEPALLAYAFDDPATRDIVVAHVIKTLVVALDEVRATGDARPLLATLRVAASPIRERRAARAVHDAIQLVVHGKIPRDLTASGGG